MECLTSFFDSKFFIIFGGISTIIVIVGVLYTLWLIVRGVVPVLYRLGLGLSKRDIAIVSADQFTSLRDLLLDSKLFQAKNLHQVHIRDIQKAAKMTVIIAHWDHIKDDLESVLQVKRDQDALIVYAPQGEGTLNAESLDAINKHRSTILVNFRGRLMNDVVSSMISTSHAAQ